MSNGQSYYGSLCLDDILEYARQKHPAYSRSPKNNKAYININVWVNETANDQGNHISIQLQKPKGAPKEEKNIYLGNAKKSEGPKPFTDKDASKYDMPDIPTREPHTNSGGSDLNPAGASEDLPF